MKCPHCNYEHIAGGCSTEPPYDWIDQVGYEPFYSLAVQMEQPDAYRSC